MRWSDAVERMMLIKVVEQNLNIKLDVGEALKSWPAGFDKPTKRSIGDRFALLKKQIREGRVSVTVGSGGSTMAAATPSRADRTPQKRKGGTTQREPSEESSVDDQASDEEESTRDARMKPRTRVQPIRRSKSITPKLYLRNDESDRNESTSDQSATEAGDESDVPFDPRPLKALAKKRRGHNLDRLVKKRKIGWEERIAISKGRADPVAYDDDEQNDDLQC